MNAAKLGVKCSTAACVGSDEKGDFILDFYKRLSGDSNNINTEMVQRTTQAPTSATILPIRPNGCINAGRPIGCLCLRAILNEFAVPRFFIMEGLVF
jgi:sugar/nucleoside kinase (ribokinase family)